MLMVELDGKAVSVLPFYVLNLTLNHDLNPHVLTGIKNKIKIRIKSFSLKQGCFTYFKSDWQAERNFSSPAFVFASM